mmetsp:Transcript_22160/g.53970  ORF Transcript_22160/g.53970 Transcript_22160/m.53970 type:complete len:205 (-) Transcript_22160:831-1445(-)
MSSDVQAPPPRFCNCRANHLDDRCGLAAVKLCSRGPTLRIGSRAQTKAELAEGQSGAAAGICHPPPLMSLERPIAIMKTDHVALSRDSCAKRCWLARKVRPVVEDNRTRPAALINFKHYDVVVTGFQVWGWQEEGVLGPLCLPIPAQIESVDPHHTLGKPLWSQVGISRLPINPQNALVENRTRGGIATVDRSKRQLPYLRVVQ